MFGIIEKQSFALITRLLTLSKYITTHNINIVIPQMLLESSEINSDNTEVKLQLNLEQFTIIENTFQRILSTNDSNDNNNNIFMNYESLQSSLSIDNVTFCGLISLSMCGWNAVNNSASSAIDNSVSSVASSDVSNSQQPNEFFKCVVCGRQVQCKENSVFNPITQHRSYCPFINETINNQYTLCGWKLIYYRILFPNEIIIDINKYNNNNLFNENIENKKMERKQEIKDNKEETPERKYKRMRILLANVAS